MSPDLCVCFILAAPVPLSLCCSRMRQQLHHFLLFSDPLQHHHPHHPHHHRRHYDRHPWHHQTFHHHHHYHHHPHHPPPLPVVRWRRLAGDLGAGDDVIISRREQRLRRIQRPSRYIDNRRQSPAGCPSSSRRLRTPEWPRRARRWCPSGIPSWSRRRRSRTGAPRPLWASGRAAGRLSGRAAPLAAPCFRSKSGKGRRKGVQLLSNHWWNIIIYNGINMIWM